VFLAQVLSEASRNVQKWLETIITDVPQAPEDCITMVTILVRGNTMGRVRRFDTYIIHFKDGLHKEVVLMEVLASARHDYP